MYFSLGFIGRSESYMGMLERLPGLHTSRKVFRLCMKQLTCGLSVRKSRRMWYLSVSATEKLNILSHKA